MNRLSYKEVEALYRRVKGSYPSPELSRQLHMETRGNMVRIFSVSDEDVTGANIDMNEGILIATSGFKQGVSSSNRVLELPFLLNGMRMDIDGHVSVVSDDRMGLGRITAISGHFNSHSPLACIRHEMIRPMRSYPCSEQLFPFDGLFGGTERVFRIPVHERVRDTYVELTRPIVDMAGKGPFFIDLTIGLLYYESSLMQSPLCPDVLHVKARGRSCGWDFKYQFKLDNN